MDLNQSLENGTKTLNIFANNNKKRNVEPENFPIKSSALQKFSVAQ